MRLEGYVHGFEIDADHSLHIYQGSLVRVQADALVSSDDNYLSAEGGVSLALALAAGFDVDRERQQIVREHRPTLGEVVRTSGGGLPCRYLYHAITIDFDRNAYMDEAALRKLIANLLKQATADGVRSIGMPALGTGAVSFNLDRASEIIIDELLIRLVDTPIQRVILALMGNEAERLFYESIVRSRADRLATIALRRRERHAGEPATPPGPAGSIHAPTTGSRAPSSRGRVYALGRIGRPSRPWELSQMLHKASAPPPDAGRGVADKPIPMMVSHECAGEHGFTHLGQELDRLGFR